MGWFQIPHFPAFAWEDTFAPTAAVPELVLRGTVVYLALFFLLRLVLKRESGGIAITDLLVVVLIADAAQNAMAGQYRSVGDGLVLVGTLVFWCYALDWLGYHFPAIRRFVHPEALLLVKDGRMLRRNMSRELITEEELMTQLRERGIEDLAQVKEAFMEGDGRISVISRENGPGSAPGTQ